MRSRLPVELLLSLHLRNWDFVSLSQGADRFKLTSSLFSRKIFLKASRLLAVAALITLFSCVFSSRMPG